MTEPRICYFFIKLAVGRTLFLLLLFWIVLFIVLRKRLGSRGFLEKILHTWSAFVIAGLASIMLLCAVDAATAAINPAGYGICYKINASHSYIPAIAVLCDDNGYRTDEYGVPLFNSYDEYTEWYINKFPEKAFPDPDEGYTYTSEELAYMAIEYYDSHSTGPPAAECYVTQGEKHNQIILTVVDENGTVLETYEIDRETLKGINDEYGPIDLGESYFSATEMWIPRTIRRTENEWNETERYGRRAGSGSHSNDRSWCICCWDSYFAHCA